MEEKEDNSDLLKRARDLFARAEDAESHNRQTFSDDVTFARAGDQWPEHIRDQRENEGRPCLTINKMPSFIRQVVNDARMNKPSIKVHPVDDNADKVTADVINGIIRNIEVVSKADVAYDTAIENAVSGGFGFIRVGLDYAYDDSFDLDVTIERVANPLSVYGDPYSQSADGSDWNTAFVTDRISKDEFQERYGEASEVDWDHDSWSSQEVGSWRNEDGILIAEWWQREEVEGQIFQLQGGEIVSDEQIENDQDIATLIEAGINPIVKARKVKRYKVTQRIMTGFEILETNEWPGRYIPIVPVYGDEFNIDGKRYWRSLIHNAKDAQRMHNFWRTNATELVALAPRVPWVGEQGAFDADPNGWATANTVSHAYLEYKKGAMPPQRQPLDTGSAAGSLTEALHASDDMKAIIGIYDASLGARSNETSGRAIMARQREGDISTFHFIDNLSRAIRQIGCIIVDLVPHVYDAPRIMRVMGEDGTENSVQVNQEYEAGEVDSMGQAIIAMHDLTVGKYDVTVTSGPSFTSRREEAAYQMTEFVRAYPAAAPVMGDLIAKNSDWPDADTVAERLEALLPPPAQGQSPETQMLSMQLQEAQAALAQIQQDKSLDAEKIRIDAFDAQTRRKKVDGDLAAKADEIDIKEDELAIKARASNQQYQQ